MYVGALIASEKKTREADRISSSLRMLLFAEMTCPIANHSVEVIVRRLESHRFHTQTVALRNSPLSGILEVERAIRRVKIV